MSPEITIRITMEPETSTSAGTQPRVAVGSPGAMLPVPEETGPAAVGIEQALAVPAPAPLPGGGDLGPTSTAAALPTPLDGLAGLPNGGPAARPGPFAAMPGDAGSPAPVSPDDLPLPGR